MKTGRPTVNHADTYVIFSNIFRFVLLVSSEVPEETKLIALAFGAFDFAREREMEPVSTTTTTTPTVTAPKPSNALTPGQAFETVEATAGKPYTDGGVQYINIGADPKIIRGSLSYGHGSVNLPRTIELNKGKSVSIGIQINENVTGHRTDKDKANEAELAAMYREYKEANGDKTISEIVDEHAARGSEVAQNLKTLGDVISENPDTHFELRPGYEVDGYWNEHTSGDNGNFKDAFRMISGYISKDDSGRNLGGNTSIVLQTAAYPVRLTPELAEQRYNTGPNAGQHPQEKVDEMPNYDIYGGGAPTEANQHAQLEKYDPGAEFYDTVGISIFRTDQSHELYQKGGDEGNFGSLKAIRDGVANYARSKGKTLQISEISPKGAFYDTDKINVRIANYNEANGVSFPMLEPHQVPVLTAGTQEALISHFFDGAQNEDGTYGGFDDPTDPTPNASIKLRTDVESSFQGDTLQYIRDNNDIITSVNLIMDDWESFWGWSSIVDGKVEFEEDGVTPKRRILSHDGKTSIIDSSDITIPEDDSWGNGLDDKWAQAYKDALSASQSS